MVGRVVPHGGRTDGVAVHLEFRGIDELVPLTDDERSPGRFEVGGIGEGRRQWAVDRWSDANVGDRRIGFGLPSGSGITYADPATLKSALEGRRDY